MALSRGLGGQNTVIYMKLSTQASTSFLYALLTGAECWKGLLKTRKAQKRWKPDVVLIIVLKSANELEACVTV